jgi:hypothetical protein
MFLQSNTSVVRGMGNSIPYSDAMKPDIVLFWVLVCRGIQEIMSDAIEYATK